MKNGGIAVVAIALVVTIAIVSAWASQSPTGKGGPPTEMVVGADPTAGHTNDGEIPPLPVVESVDIDLGRSSELTQEPAQRIPQQNPAMSAADIWSILNDAERMAALSDAEQARLTVLFGRGILEQQTYKVILTEESALLTLLAEIQPGKPIDRLPAELVESAKQLVARHRRELMEATRKANQIHEATLLNAIDSGRIYSVPKPDAAALAAEAADPHLRDRRRELEAKTLNAFWEQWLGGMGRSLENRGNVEMVQTGSQYGRSQFHLFWSDVDSPDWFESRQRLEFIKQRVQSERAAFVNRYR